MIAELSVSTVTVKGFIALKMVVELGRDAQRFYFNMAHQSNTSYSFPVCLLPLVPPSEAAGHELCGKHVVLFVTRES